MKRIALVAVVLGVLAVALAPAFAKADNRQPTMTTAVATPADQGAVTPVHWWGPRAYYGGYRAYWGPRYYYPGPVYRYRSYPGWGAYGYRPGFYYYAPRASFYFSY